MKKGPQKSAAFWGESENAEKAKLLRDSAEASKKADSAEKVES